VGVGFHTDAFQLRLDNVADMEIGDHLATCRPETCHFPK